jgi:CRP-like cAMP-binding protein
VNSPVNGSRNRLLAVLSHADRDLVTPGLEVIALDARQVLETPGDPIDHVYFVESGLVSVVGASQPDHRIEVGMVGYEGMTGLALVLGDDRSVNETMVQSAGSAQRLPGKALRKMMAASESFTATLLRYVNVFMVQGSQTALANGRGRLDERLARWLLMWHDRVESNEFPTTHELLALLLGVRRAGVTVGPARARRQRLDPLLARSDPHRRPAWSAARGQRLLWHSGVPVRAFDWFRFRKAVVTVALRELEGGGLRGPPRATRRAAELHGRRARPALEGPHERRRLSIAGHVGHLGDTHVGLLQIVLGRLASCLIQQGTEALAAPGQPPLQGLAAHVQLIGDRIDIGRASGKPLDDKSSDFANEVLHLGSWPDNLLAS